MDANKILKTDFLDLLFEGRNKAYGAYELRRAYNKRLLMALGITGLILLGITGGAILKSSLKSKDDDKVKMSGLGGFLRKAKRVIERTTNINTGEGIKVAGFEIALK